MDSTSSSNSPMSFSFKWRCCSFVILKSPWQKPVLTTHLSRNRHWGSHLAFFAYFYFNFFTTILFKPLPLPLKAYYSPLPPPPTAGGWGRGGGGEPPPLLPAHRTNNSYKSKYHNIETINMQKKVRKTLILLFCDFFLTFFPLKTDVKAKKLWKKKLIFCWHLVSHLRKKQDPDPNL